MKQNQIYKSENDKKNMKKKITVAIFNSKKSSILIF